MNNFAVNIKGLAGMANQMRRSVLEEGILDGRSEAQRDMLCRTA